MTVVILANCAALANAAHGLRGASKVLAPRHAVPSTGDGETDGALGHLSSVLHAHSANLSRAASDAPRAMEGFIVSFHEAGGGCLQAATPWVCAGCKASSPPRRPTAPARDPPWPG